MSIESEAQTFPTAFISTKAVAFAMIHHLSTTLSALQQCVVSPRGAAFPPSQHHSNTMCRACMPTGVCVCVCVCVCVLCKRSVLG